MFDMLDAARAEALFVSTLSAGTVLDRTTATAAIRAEIIRHHGVRGCACDVAYAFGDHPDTAPARMRWALSAVAATFDHHPRRCVVLRSSHTTPPAAVAA
jgi:hypothetical protein